MISVLIIVIIQNKKNKNKKTKNKKTKNKKFFKELPNHNHLDYRYGKLNNQNKHKTLIYLLKRFMDYSHENKIKPILMYGGLIGYYFNNKLLPWDDDIDMILLKPSSDKLKNYEDDKILIEVNPNCNNYSVTDSQNKISSRVISKENGLFIDLTFFIEQGNYWVCKDGNKFIKKDIIQYNDEKYLKRGIFEGISVWIPNNIENCLRTKYGENVFTPLKNKGFIFNKKTKTWKKI